MKSSGFSIIRWQSNGMFGTALRSDFTTGGPIVMLGTKWPSMTSTCSTVPPPSIAAFACSPRREKSAERIDGASSICTMFLVNTASIRKTADRPRKMCALSTTSMSLRQPQLPVNFARREDVDGAWPDTLAVLFVFAAARCAHFGQRSVRRCSLLAWQSSSARITSSACDRLTNGFALPSSTSRTLA